LFEGYIDYKRVNVEVYLTCSENQTSERILRLRTS